MSDRFVHDLAIIGSEQQCREQLAAFVAAGVTTPVLAPLAGDRKGAEAVFAAFAPSRR